MAEMVARRYDLYNITIAGPADYQLNALELELHCYRCDWPVEKGGLGAAGHFRKIAELLYGPKSHEPFGWNPWAERMNEVIHQHPISGKARPHCAFSGCASSNKSHFSGLYAIINWLCAPRDTYVFITSTSISEAKHRVWKSVSKLFSAVPGLPGKLVDSMAKIVTTIPGKRHNDTAGIFIVAGSPGKARQSIGKLIGRKNKRVIFIADELPELSPAILDGAFGNLMSNPFFQFVAMGNFKSREDPFGEFVQPKDGWDSVSSDADEWEIGRDGYCVRFDGMKSPNILAGKDLYPYLYGSKQLREHKQNYGDRSAMFWRMCRSAEAPIGTDDTFYSEADFIAGKAYSEPEWLGRKIRVSSLDPSFTNGGDRCFQHFGWYGKDVNGVSVLSFDTHKLLREDVTIKGVNRDYQIARQFRDNCIKEGVEPKHAAMDATGAGAVLWSIVAEEWSYAVLKVEFWGAASDLPANATDGKTGKQCFDRRVSELWGVGKEFLRGCQLRGLKSSTTREMKARKYTTVKGEDGAKMKAETKQEMKERLNFSPDDADSAFVMLELCRVRLGFRPVGMPTQSNKPRHSFMALAKRNDEVYTSMYSGDE